VFVPIGQPDAVTATTEAGRRADAAYLLAELRRRGYAVGRTDDGLSVGPASRLTEGEREEIVQYKPELVTLLFEGR
jgi:hypothetical protein